MRLLVRCLTAAALAASLLTVAVDSPVLAASADAVALQPVADSAACLALLGTQPKFTSLEAAESFSTTGPCAPASSAAALASVGCFAVGIGANDYAIISGLLYGFYNSLYMLGCEDNTGRNATVLCTSGNVAPGAPPVNAMAEPGLAGNCSAQTITTESLPGTAVYWGLGFAVSTNGGVYTTGFRFALYNIG